MAGNYCPGELDEFWLLKRLPSATEDDVCDFIELVGSELEAGAETEEEAREKAFLKIKNGRTLKNENE